MSYERKTVDLLISDELRKILEEIESESIVASLLLKKRHDKEDLVENHVNYISISKEDISKISYLTSERRNDLTEDVYWTSSRRFQAKPGSFISKLFKNIQAKEVEKFSNLFRSQSLKPTFTFEVVKGEEIRKFYLYKTYSSDRGSLGASCMKHDPCQKFLDIYVENKDKVSLLIMLDENKLLLGRAILWDFESNKVMDRIYTTKDEDLSFYFKQWATKNNYIYKLDQNWSNTLFFEKIGTKKEEIKFEIKLENFDFKYYPYMDTFKFININNGTLYNYIPENKSFIRTLASADGSKMNGECYILDEVNRIYRNRGECVYLDYLQIYTYSGNTKWSTINDQYILVKDCIMNDRIGDYIFNEEYDQFNSKRVKEYKDSDTKKANKVSEESRSDIRFRGRPIYSDAIISQTESVTQVTEELEPAMGDVQETGSEMYIAVDFNNESIRDVESSTQTEEPTAETAAEPAISTMSNLFSTFNSFYRTHIGNEYTDGSSEQSSEQSHDGASSDQTSSDQTSSSQNSSDDLEIAMYDL